MSRPSSPHALCCFGVWYNALNDLGNVWSCANLLYCPENHLMHSSFLAEGGRCRRDSPYPLSYIPASDVNSPCGRFSSFQFTSSTPLVLRCTCAPYTLSHAGRSSGTRRGLLGMGRRSSVLSSPFPPTSIRWLTYGIAVASGALRASFYVLYQI